ncbi:MAG: hypothetical protein U9R75_05490 [Candidatus Thermoplasmatota archaeon]|nr:hypothetical protein [Candidatus Thermoplasmatota archaeon]
MRSARQSPGEDALNCNSGRIFHSVPFVLCPDSNHGRSSEGEAGVRKTLSLLCSENNMCDHDHTGI